MIFNYYKSDAAGTYVGIPLSKTAGQYSDRDTKVVYTSATDIQTTHIEKEASSRAGYCNIR